MAAYDAQYWNDFYAATVEPVAAQARQWSLIGTYDPIGPGVGNWGHFVESMGLNVSNDTATGADTFQKGSPFVTLPDGQVVKSSGSRATDLLTRIFGVSPFAGETQTYDPKSGEPLDITVHGGMTDPFAWLGDQVARFAIIVLGFIFVAVGLSMFKDNGINITLPK